MQDIMYNSLRRIVLTPVSTVTASTAPTASALSEVSSSRLSNDALMGLFERFNVFCLNNSVVLVL